MLIIMSIILDSILSSEKEERENLKRRLESYGEGEVIDCRSYC